MAPISSNFNQVAVPQSTSNFNQVAAQQSTSSINQQSSNSGTQQTSANLGLGPDLANIANALPAQQLQQIMNSNQGFDQFGGAGMNNPANMPLAAQTPFNIMSPGSAYANNMPMMAPTYYPGSMQMPMPQMLNQMQSQFPMSQQYMQQAFAQPGMQQMLQQYYGNPNNTNMPMGPGGPFGGVAGLNIPQQGGSSGVPGSENLTSQQVLAQQTANLKQYMDNFSEALQLSSSIESAMHNARMSIIQNIR